jgi:hypothetical protein
MTLSAASLLLMLTTKSGAAGSSTTSTPAESLGKYASTTQVVSAAVGAVFDTVTAPQAAAGYVDYRCLAVRNDSATDAATNASVYLTDTSAGGVYAVGIDPAGIVAYDSAAVQGTAIAAKTDYPTGVTLSAPSFASPLAIGTMGANTVALLWIRRTVAAGTPGTGADSFTLSVRAETT